MKSRLLNVTSVRFWATETSKSLTRLRHASIPELFVKESNTKLKFKSSSLSHLQAEHRKYEVGLNICHFNLKALNERRVISNVWWRKKTVEVQTTGDKAYFISFSITSYAQCMDIKKHTPFPPEIVSR